MQNFRQRIQNTKQQTTPYNRTDVADQLAQPSCLPQVISKLLIHHDFLFPKTDHQHEKCYIPVEVCIVSHKICAGQDLWLPLSREVKTEGLQC